MSCRWLIICTLFCATVLGGKAQKFHGTWYAVYETMLVKAHVTLQIDRTEDEAYKAHVTTNIPMYKHISINIVETKENKIHLKNHKRGRFLFDGELLDERLFGIAKYGHMSFPLIFCKTKEEAEQVVKKNVLTEEVPKGKKDCSGLIAPFPETLSCPCVLAI